MNCSSFSGVPKAPPKYLLRMSFQAFSITSIWTSVFSSAFFARYLQIRNLSHDYTLLMWLRIARVCTMCSPSISTIGT